MVNPGVFHGLRKEFLVGQKPYYAKAVADDHTKDAVADIQRRFFKRFPPELPWEEEPSLAKLAAVNDEDPDQEELDVDDAADDEDQEMNASRLERAAIVEKRKGQIRRWLHYQYMKDNDVEPKEANGLTPIRVLLLKLTGKGVEKPRQKTACNVWRKTQRETIEIVAKREAEKRKANGEKVSLITIRDRIAREEFAKLSKEQQKEWKQKAVDDHKVVLAQFERDCSQPPATDPESRQLAIQGLTAFIQPILDLVCEATGWKASFIAGGPEPAKKGGLSILSVHSGETKGDVKMNFGRAERIWYKDSFVRAYGGFLRKCYTPEDCQNIALDNDSVAEPLDPKLLEAAEANLDDISWDRSPSDPSQSATPAQQGALLPGSTADLVKDGRAPVVRQNIGGSEPTQRSSNAINDGIVGTVGTQEDHGSPGLGHLNSHFQVPDSPILGGPPPDPFSPLRSPLLGISPLPSPSPPLLLPIALAGSAVSLHSQGTTTPTRPIATAIRDVHALGHKRKRNGDNSPSINPAAISATATGTHSKRAKRQVASSSIPSSSSPQSSAHPVAQPVTAGTAVNVVNIPTTAPEWFKNVHTMFESVNMGPLWANALRNWTAFEIKEDFKATPFLKATNRPPQVAKWVQNKRAPTFRLPVTDIPTYSNSFIKWWTCVQPTWRLKDGSIISGGDGNWDALRKSGVNGLISVVVALFFWGELLSGKGHTEGTWAEMVKDFAFVCSALTNA